MEKLEIAMNVDHAAAKKPVCVGNERKGEVVATSDNLGNRRGDINIMIGSVVNWRGELKRLGLVRAADRGWCTVRQDKHRGKDHR